MNAAAFRRILFSLVPVELACLVLIAAGVDLPGPFRLAVLALLIATLVVEISIWIGAFRRFRRDGASRPTAAKNATRHVIGDRLWGFITSEFSLVGSIARLIARKPDVPDGTRGFTYHRQSAPMMWAMVGLVVIEIAVVHLVIPWDIVRLVLLVVSVYSLIWIVGFIAGFMVRPHLLDDRTLVLRHGPKTVVVLPLTDIERIETTGRDLSGMRSIRYVDGSGLHLAQGGQTNVDVTLTRPINGVLQAEVHPVDRVSFWADDPDLLARDVRAAGQ